MESPTFWDNPEKAQKTIQATKPLNAVIQPYEKIEASMKDIHAMAELAEMDESFESEMPDELDKAQALLDAFEFQAMMSGRHDAFPALVSIHAGAGGTDACDWAQALMRMYSRWAEKQGFKVELVDSIENEEAGIQSCTLRIDGAYAYGHLQSEIGVHRLVRISPFGGGDTRQTSFAAVEVLPEIEDNIEIVVNDGDLIMQTFCTGGPGGQHQNKTQSGVRLIHKPTGLRGESRTERQQGKNYNNALNQLKARMLAVEEAKRTGDIEQRYDSKGEIAFGSQIRSYVMHSYTLVRDVLDGIDVKTPAVLAVLDGELDPFMQAYLRYKTEREHKRKKKATA